jgi:hypothetical protein
MWVAPGFSDCRSDVEEGAAKSVIRKAAGCTVLQRLRLIPCDLVVAPAFGVRRMPPLSSLAGAQLTDNFNRALWKR